MIRVIIEQGLLQLFDQVLKPLDRERIRGLVQESLDKEDPAILRELLKEISFIGPLERSVASWAESFRDAEGPAPPRPPEQGAPASPAGDADDEGSP